jgi:hypothetical protein
VLGLMTWYDLKESRAKESAMAIKIDGVPESISRDKFIELMEGIGLDPWKLVHLDFGWHSIRATVHATDANGRNYRDPMDRDDLAKHEICIKVVD